MNSFSIAWNAIVTRRLGSSLCVIAAGAGIALLCAVILLTSAVHDGLIRNAAGIDVVIGAKGSPLQLVLSTVYHADVPNGNIEADEAAHIEHDPKIASFIPLALGDNHLGFRIVGTTPAYPALYQAKLANGVMFDKPFDAVAGALTGLSVGNAFNAAHGLAADSDDIHHYHQYLITGTLKPTGTVLDRLILTSVDSVQSIHAHPDLGDDDAAEDIKISHEITALLVHVRSPIDIINLPRQINRSSNTLAASPAYEMTRFSQSMGFGRQVLSVLAAGFVALSALVLLSTLATGLAARRYDLGVLRVLGASPARLFSTVIIEGALLGGAGAVTGIIAGHILAWAVASCIESLQGLMVPTTLLLPQPFDLALLSLGASVGLLAALIPALSAARTDIAGLLARGRA